MQNNSKVNTILSALIIFLMLTVTFPAIVSADSCTVVTVPTEAGMYDASGISIAKGELSVEVMIDPGVERIEGDHVIFHTNDNRLILYFDTYYSSIGREIQRFAARAGGDLRAVDQKINLSVYPEASIILDPDNTLSAYRYDWYKPFLFKKGEWHTIRMTWDGYPDGSVSIYLDNELSGTHSYSKDFDGGGDLFTKFAIGQLPGELSSNTANDGLVPLTGMLLKDSGILIRNMKISHCTAAPTVIPTPMPTPVKVNPVISPEPKVIPTPTIELPHSEVVVPRPSIESGFQLHSPSSVDTDLSMEMNTEIEKTKTTFFLKVKDSFLKIFRPIFRSKNEKLNVE